MSHTCKSCKSPTKPAMNTGSLSFDDQADQTYINFAVSCTMDLALKNPDNADAQLGVAAVIHHFRNQPRHAVQ